MGTKFDVQNAGGESLSTDGLLDTREQANALAEEIEQDTDGAVECSVVEVEVHPDGCSCGSQDCQQWQAAQERITTDDSGCEADGKYAAGWNS